MSNKPTPTSYFILSGKPNDEFDNLIQASDPAEIVDDTFLEPSQKHQDIWKRVMFKIKIQKALKKFKEDILMYGTSTNLLDLDNNYRENLSSIIQKKINRQETFRLNQLRTQVEEPKPWYIIHPDSTFLKLWSLVITVLLVYTATIMPYRLAFTELVFWDFWTGLEVGIDMLFCADIIVNIVSGYYEGDGSLQFNLRTIFKHYLFSWLLLDLSASIPFGLIDYLAGGDESSSTATRSNTLMRLLRLPRIYKLLKLTRIFKLIKNSENTQCYERLQDFFHMHARSLKLLKFSLSICLCIHIAGCIWFYTGKIDGFGPDSWVVRNNIVNDPPNSQYLTSIYWAFTTITTVGYGDISARTDIELIIAIFWMLAGVGFYSFTIGTLTSLLSEQDTRESVLVSKLAAITDFQKETGIPQECTKKMRKVVKYNSSKGDVVWKDKMTLFKELPKSLRFEIAMSMYDGIAKQLTFFKDKDQAFVIEIMPLLRPAKFEDAEYVYKEHEYTDELYLITRGRVNLVLMESEITYKSYLKGSYFGDTEILQKIEYRVDSAQACGILELLVINRKDFLAVLEDFPMIRGQFHTIAQERLARHRKEKEEVHTLVVLSAHKASPGLPQPMSPRKFSVACAPKPVSETLDDIEARLASMEQLVSGITQRVATSGRQSSPARKPGRFIVSP